jgi:CRP/FNR family transcriptional regulator, anaerobic regulatory protein
MSQPDIHSVGELEELKVACRDCSLFQLCLPVGLDAEELARLDRLIRRRRVLRRGEYLFRPGDPFVFVYAVRSGSVKTYAPVRDGSEQVTGFHLPGELLGLDAIHTERHQCGAVALETTGICELPLNRMEELGSAVTNLQRRMLRIMSRQILHDQTLQVLLCKRSAEERLAALLLSLSNRYKRRGFSAAEFHLSMSRQEIASYLGLAEETVSRLFTRLQEQGLIEVLRKRVHLLNLRRLTSMVGTPERLG